MVLCGILKFVHVRRMGNFKGCECPRSQLPRTNLYGEAMSERTRRPMFLGKFFADTAYPWSGPGRTLPSPVHAIHDRMIVIIVVILALLIRGDGLTGKKSKDPEKGGSRRQIAAKLASESGTE